MQCQSHVLLNLGKKVHRAITNNLLLDVVYHFVTNLLVVRWYMDRIIELTLHYEQEIHHAIRYGCIAASELG
jgi:hypothetical protein